MYDLTSYVEQHPGGDAILRAAGKDASLGFHQVSAHKIVKGMINGILEKNYLGHISSSKDDT